MKKLQFMAWPKLCTAVLLGTAALFMASCAQDGFDNDEKWESSVSNAQLSSPKADDIKVVPDATGNYQIFSWPVVLGASSYQCSLIDATDPDNRKTIYSGNVDGCSLKTAKEDDAVYEFSIKTIGNASKGNKDAKETTVVNFNTIIPTYKTIKSGTDLATFFESETIPDNETDPNTKQLIPVAYDLEAKGSYTMSGTINLGYHKVLIRTQKTTKIDDKEVVVKAVDYATVTLSASTPSGDEDPGKTCFMIQHGFSLKSLKFDCTNATGDGLIIMSDADHMDSRVKKNEEYFPSAQNKGRNAIAEPIEVKDCLIKNLKKRLFYTNKTQWAIGSLNVIGNIIQLDNSGSTLLDCWYSGSGDGAIKNLLVQNNTIYDISSKSAFYFIRFDHGSNAIKLFSPSDKPIDKTFILEISNNTLMRTSVNTNFGNNVPGNHCINNVMQNNIFIDVNNLNKYALSQQERVTSGNYIWTIERTSTPAEDEKLCTVENPGITVPSTELDLTKENGGLTGLTPSGGALDKRSGDPRWLPTE